MAWDSKKGSLKTTGIIVGVVVVVVGYFLFFNEKGKALKTSVVGFFTSLFTKKP